MKRIGTWLVNILLRGILCLVGIMPRFVLCGISNFLAFLAERLIGYRRKVVMSNLRLVFPEKSEKELRRIATASYRSFVDGTLNIFRIRYASQKRVLRTMTCKNVELLQQLYAKGKDGVIMAGHYSCWEYIGVLQLDIKHQTVAAYQPLTFAPLENVIAEARGRFGAKMAALKDIFRVLFECNRQGKKTMTLMVSDQSPHQGSCTHWIKFMGQITPVLVGPERIAQKINAAAMYLRIKEPKRFHYEYELILLSENAAQEGPMVITKKFYAELETDLHRAPQYWMWTHKRWKHQNLYNGETI